MIDEGYMMETSAMPVSGTKKRGAVVWDTMISNVTARKLKMKNSVSNMLKNIRKETSGQVR